MSEKLKNAPVYFTIAQVQHNPLLSLESYIPAVQEKMRKAGYPDFKRAMSIQFDLGSASIGNESQIAQPTSQRIEKYIFANLKRSTAFVMLPQSVAVDLH